MHHACTFTAQGLVRLFEVVVAEHRRAYVRQKENAFKCQQPNLIGEIVKQRNRPGIVVFSRRFALLDVLPSTLPGRGIGYGGAVFCPSPLF